MLRIAMLTTLVAVRMMVSAQTMEDAILRAIQLSEYGKTSEAILVLDNIIEDYGDSPILRILKGEIYSGGERRLTTNPAMYNAAVSEFNKAIELDSGFAPAYNARALLNIFHQRFALAVKDLSKVIALTTDDQEALFNAYADRGSCRLYLRDYSEALNDYNTALTLREGTSSLYANLGILHARLNNVRKAEEMFNKGLLLDSLSVEIMNNRAMTYLWNNRPKEAMEILRTALRINPDNALLHNNLGLALVRLGKPSEAITYIEKSLSLYPDNAYAYKHLGMARQAMKMKTEACSAWQKALELGYAVAYDDEVDRLISRHCRKNKSGPR